MAQLPLARVPEPTIELVYLSTNKNEYHTYRYSMGRWDLPEQATTPKWVIRCLLANSKRFPGMFSDQHPLQWVMRPSSSSSATGVVCEMNELIDHSMGWHEIQLYDMHESNTGTTKIPT